jgi:hypothetical protein
MGGHGIALSHAPKNHYVVRGRRGAASA